MHRVPLKRSRPTGGGPVAVRSRRGAFTLLELTVVIVIIAALAALIMSNVGQTAADAEQIAARATMQTIAEAFTGSPSGPGYVADMKYVPDFLGRRIPVTSSTWRDVRVHDLLDQGDEGTLGWQPKFDPPTQRGWRGPYMLNVVGPRNTNQATAGFFPAPTDVRFFGDSSFSQRGFFDADKNQNYVSGSDIVVGDPWGNPIILQVPPNEAFDSPTENKRWRFARLVSAGPDGKLTTPLYDPAASNPKLDSRLAGRRSGGIKETRDDDLVLFLNRSDVYETAE